MTRKETIILLNVWLDTYKQIDRAYESFRKLTGCIPESEIAQALYQPFDRYTDAVSKLVGDQGKWLEWFIWDNGCGEKGYEAHIGGKTIKVYNVKDLERVIRLHRQ